MYRLKSFYVSHQTSADFPTVQFAAFKTNDKCIGSALITKLKICFLLTQLLRLAY